MNHHQMQLAWCLAFTVVTGVLVGTGSNWWLGAAASMALFAVHNMMLSSS